MNWQELINSGYGYVLNVLERALSDLGQDDLNQQPNPDCNSIGWLAWHLTRGQDAMISSLLDVEQIWISEGWCNKFNLPYGPKDTGFGHSSEQVTTFSSPDVSTLLDYHRQVLERTKKYITNLSEEDLGREMSGPFPTLGARLLVILSDDLQHAGQIAYLRGLLKGKGWSNI